MGIGRSLDCSMVSKKTNKKDIHHLGLLHAHYWRGNIHMTTQRRVSILQPFPAMHRHADAEAHTARSFVIVTTSA